MVKYRVNYIDVGALDGNEAISFFYYSDPFLLSLARDLLDLSRRFVGKTPLRPPFAALHSRTRLKRGRLYSKKLESHELAMKFLLVDPQLSFRGIDKLRKVAPRVGNFEIFELRAAVGLGDAGAGFETLYMGKVPKVKFGLFPSPGLRDHRVGASLFDSKTNIDKEKSVNAFSISAESFGDLLEDMDLLNPLSFNVLRMNAEGIEFDILQELRDRGLLGNIDVLCGSGHDLAKINPRRFAQFQDFLSENQLTFEMFGGDDWRRLKFHEEYEKLIVRGAIAKANPDSEES